MTRRSLKRAIEKVRREMVECAWCHSLFFPPRGFEGPSSPVCAHCSVGKDMICPYCSMPLHLNKKIRKRPRRSR